MAEVVIDLRNASWTSQVNRYTVIIGLAVVFLIGAVAYYLVQGLNDPLTCNLSASLVTAESIAGTPSTSMASCEFVCRNANQECCLLGFTTSTIDFNVIETGATLPANGETPVNITVHACDTPFAVVPPNGGGCLCCIKAIGTGGTGLVNGILNAGADAFASQLNAGDYGRQNTCGLKGFLGIPTYMNSAL
jgi:hypothetical protein